MYFDFSNGKPNAETNSTKQGVDIAYNLEKLDQDIVEGLSLGGNLQNIQALQKVIEQNNEQLSVLIGLVKSNTLMLKSILTPFSNSNMGKPRYIG